MRSDWWRVALLPLLLSGLFLCVSASAQEDPPDNEPESAAPSGPTKAVLGEPFPELAASEWANFEGRPRLQRFRDQIVVVFFFRTDDASADTIPIVTKAHRTFANRGVAFVGLTPQRKESAESAVRGKDVRFIVGFGAPTDERYQVSSFPKVYLLDTSGRLVNRFHPREELEEKIAAQIRRTPPAGSDSQSLKDRFERARNEHRKGAYGKAYTLVLDVRKVAEAESSVGKAAADLLRQIDESARKWLVEAQDAAREEQFDKAIRILAELSVRFAGTDTGAAADTEIGRLMGTRDLKPKVRKALDNARGELLLDQAADHEAGRRYLEALKVYRQTIEDYGDTDASKAAEQAIERIQGDKQIQETIRTLWAEEEADRWLDIAERFAKVEMYGKAREFYQRILDTHPKARAAARAKEQLPKLPVEEKPADAEEAPPIEGEAEPEEE